MTSLTLNDSDVAELAKGESAPNRRLLLTDKWEPHGTAEAPLLAETEVELFLRGEDFRAYEKLGAHLKVVNGVAGVHSAVWAQPPLFAQPDPATAERIVFRQPDTNRRHRTVTMQTKRTFSRHHLFVVQPLGWIFHTYRETSAGSSRRRKEASRLKRALPPPAHGGGCGVYETDGAGCFGAYKQAKAWTTNGAWTAAD